MRICGRGKFQRNPWEGGRNRSLRGKEGEGSAVSEISIRERKLCSLGNKGDERTKKVGGAEVS